MAEAEEKSEATPQEAPSKSKASLLVPALAGVNTLLTAAILAVLLLRPQVAREHGPEDPKASQSDSQTDKAKGEKDKDKDKDKGKGKDKDKEALPGPTLKLADFVVHLRDTDTDRYARLAFEMELADEKAKEALTARMPLVRDAFLMYLSDRTSEDLRGGEAIAKVKATLRQKLEEVAPKVAIRGLYITEIVVQ